MPVQSAVNFDHVSLAQRRSNRRGPMQASPALLSVDLLTVADLCDDDDSVAIIDRIKDAIIALSYAVLVLFARVFPILLDADPLPTH